MAVLRAARAGELPGDEDTDNVVLYRENLQSTQGISGNSTVPEQIGIHEVNNSAPGAFLFDNGAKFHSAIHVGELQFGTDPNSAGQAPSTIINVEVDHLAGSDPHNITRNGRTILEDVRENFALYGINIRFRTDAPESNRLTDSKLSTICKDRLPDVAGCRNDFTPDSD